jgi:hypothetical protein
MRANHQSGSEVIRFWDVGQGQIKVEQEKSCYKLPAKKAASIEAAAKFCLVGSLLQNLIQVFGELASQISVGIQAADGFTIRVTILIKNNYRG